MSVQENDEQWVGSFWIPNGMGQEPVKLTGILSTAKSPAELEAMGEIVPMISWAPNPSGQGIVGTLNEDSDETTVFGEVTGLGRPVTLINAQVRNRTLTMSTRVPSANLQLLEAQYVVDGAHVDGAAQLYSSAIFSISGLEEWARLPSVSVGISEDGLGVQLGYSTPEAIQIGLSNELGTITFEAGWTLQPANNHRNVLETPSQMRWTASESGPKTFGDLIREVITPIRELLGVLYMSPQTLLFLRVQPEGAKDWADVKGYASPVSLALPPTRRAVPLLDRAALGETALAKWIADFPRLSPFTSMLVSSFASESALETQTLEMALAAEGLHRRLYPDDRRLSVEDVEEALALLVDASQASVGVKLARDALASYLFEHSFPNRLLRLAEDISEVAPEVYGIKNRWKQQVTNVRNAFAHASFSEDLPADRYPGYFALFSSLQWLILTRTLVEAGVPPEILRAAVSGNTQYRSFLRHAATSMPSVFRRS